MEVYISGGHHFFTDVERRIESIDDAMGEPDAIFLESRVAEHNRKRQAINWIAAPLLLASLNIWLLIDKIASLFLQSDDEIVAYFHKEYDIEPYEVDKPVHKIIASQSYEWGLANWSLLVIPIALVYDPFGAIGVYIALLLLITGAISITMAYLSAVHAERNIYIVTQIAEVAKNNDYEKACIITGGEHSSDLIELVHRFDGIDVVNDIENKK